MTTDSTISPARPERDLRDEHPARPALSPDWVLSLDSNVHVCNDRNWFASYTAFDSEVYASADSLTAAKVFGVGTVELTLITELSKKQPPATQTLADVLFVPGARCNIYAARTPAAKKSRVRAEKWRDGWKLLRDDGEVVARFEYRNSGSGCAVAVLSDIGRKRYAPSRLGADPLCGYGAYWWPADRVRWAEVARRKKKAAGIVDVRVGFLSRSLLGERGSPPLSAEEKGWLKRTFLNGGELEFLEIYGFSIHQEGDRDFARQLVRELMKVEGRDAAAAGGFGRHDEPDVGRRVRKANGAWLDVLLTGRRRLRVAATW